jgi:hypothetical protein
VKFSDRFFLFLFCNNKKKLAVKTMKTPVNGAGAATSASNPCEGQFSLSLYFSPSLFLSLSISLLLSLRVKEH